MNKKILCSVLAATTVMSMLAGCRATPEKSIVMGKNQDVMLDAAVNGGEDSSSLKELEVSERFTGDWTGADGCVTVHADAVVELPDVQKVPTATVTRRSFTQSDADKLLAAFIGDNTLYKEGITKQQALERLEKYQAAQRGEIPLSDVSGDAKMEKLPELIEYYAELARTAPDENDPPTASRTFEADDYFDELIDGYADVDGRTVYVHIHNFSEYSDEAICFTEGYGSYNNSYAVPYSQLEEVPEESIKEAEAVKIADELVKNLGLESVTCNQITQVAFMEGGYYSISAESAPKVKDTGYELEYARCVDGFPISYAPFSGETTSDDEAYIGVWPYESIEICVTQSGIVDFRWSSPYTEPVIETQDAQLMKFSDITDIFGKMIIVENSELKVINAENGFETRRELNVDKVSLGLMRIRGKDNISIGILVPVWDFWGTYKSDSGEYGSTEEYTVLMTINAVDGTVIDREIGY